MKKVIWMSRHPMTDAQRSSLAAKLGEDAVEVASVNPLFPDSHKAVIGYTYDRLADQGWTDAVVAGVFPAHVAIWLSREFTLAVPIAVPVKAEHGEERRFEHSHWEMF